MINEFAPGIERNEEGWVLFSTSDQELRKQFFTAEVMKHPAKANLFMVRAVYQHVSKPGETVMDITAGTGSLMLAALEDEPRRVVLIEMSPEYAMLIIESATMNKLQGDISRFMLLEGDCRSFLPVPVDHIIFSPPYAGAFNAGGGIINREARLARSIEEYRNDPRNLGNLTDFMFNQAMEKIYKLCFQSVRPGGTMTIIIKDRIKGGLRVELGLEAVRQSMLAGFQMDEWHRWKPSGHMFVAMKKARGERVVEDEHVIIMRRPE